MNGAPRDAQRTPLAALHQELGGRMVTFAGYELPVQFPQGIKSEHLWTRAHAALFDVSHMGQVLVDATPEALEGLVPSDIAGLAPFQQRYTVLTTETGGIHDDLMVSRLPDGFFVVVNAAFAERDVDILESALAADGSVRVLDRGLLALQGPAAVSVLASHAAAVRDLAFMTGMEVELLGERCLVQRSGYTGEDGFEISVPRSATEALARVLLEHPEVKPAGLGARDSLRLEAGLCLSGSDIGPGVTPVEAGLGWVVARKYKGCDPVPARFPGAGPIMRQLRAGTDRVRVGLRALGRVPVRGGALLSDEDGAPAGEVTSGGFGPSVDGPVAMGYVPRQYAQLDTRLVALVRGREIGVEVAGLPFVPHRYRRAARRGDAPRVRRSPHDEPADD